MQVAAPPTSASTPVPVADPLGVGGIRGGIADFIRGSGAGYQAATREASIVADKAAIHPFETVATATALLKDVTKNIKYVNKATSLVNTIGGFALLIGVSNVTTGLRSPGDTASDLAHRVADLIDGKKTARGWSLGWGVTTDTVTGAQHAVESGATQALSSMGMV